MFLRAHHNVYVVYLRNPNGDGKAGYYVGMTGLKYTGGTVLHLYMSERVSSPEACKRLVRRTLENFRCPTSPSRRPCRSVRSTAT